MEKPVKQTLKILSGKQLSYEITCMKDEFERIYRYVKPLTAITDLTLAKKRELNAENI